MRRPWEAVVVPHDKLPDKAAYRAFITSPGTQDCLFSGVVGEAPNLRVSRDNKPAWLLAVVADYDVPCKDRERRAGKLRVPPNFVSRSYSGGTHAVWVLERPLPLPQDAEQQEALLQAVRRDLKLQNAFGVLDDRAFENIAQYYHAGWDWVCTNPEPVSAARSMLWLDKALKKKAKSRPDIPLPVVAAEVENRFPGRWTGDFTEGARGVRFWDESADCETAAIVTEHGMVCFTGPSPFMSWEAIFGSGFVEQYRENTRGRALSSCYFVNNSFYVYSENGGVPQWLMLNRQSMESLLASEFGLRSRAEAGEDLSEVKDTVGTIIRLNAATAAYPCIYRPERLIQEDGQRVLNTSLLRVYPPEAGTGKEWGDGFPWIAAFLEGLFPDCIERERLVSEIAYAYKHAYRGRPKSGRVVFIAGGVGVGKNLLTECIIGPALGGFTDPSEFLLGHTRFNEELYSKGVWVCNDTVSHGAEKERQFFSSTLKRMAANAFHICEGKYKGSSTIRWQGRVFVTLNTDPVSLQLLPDLDISNRDKVSLYKTSGTALNDPCAAQHVREELGAFCAYLLGMEYPEHCVGDARWGVRGYLNPELLSEANTGGGTAGFEEIIAQFCKDMFKANPDLPALEGTSTWFLQQMLESSSLKEMLRGNSTARSFGKRMASLNAAKKLPVEYHRTPTERIWSIRRDAFENYLKFGSEEGGVDEHCPF